MRVLIGVDGSEGGFDAAELAGKLLSAERDDPILYYSPPEVAVRGGRTRTEPEVLERAREALAAAVFQEARTRLPAELGEKAETVVGTQRPRHGLLVAADEKRVDLIVVGARGKGPTGGILTGSVGHGVAHAAPVPVMIVRGRDEAPRKGVKVLLACDGQEPSKHAGELLKRFTWPEGSVGQVITIVESMLVGQLPEWLEQQARESDDEAMARALVEEHDQEKEEARAKMAGYCKDLPAIFADQTPIVSDGRPADEILEAIEREQPDLVVAGARGLGPVARFFMGSTSEKLLHHAPCSVLIAREHEKS